jgi:hypothetical protein
MTHEELKALVPAYSLGAVTDAESAEIERHIRSCTDCAAEARSFARVAESVAFSVTPEDPPAGFVERTMEAAEASGAASAPARSGWRKWWVPAFVAATAIAVIVSAVTLIGSMSNADRQKQVVATLSRFDGIALSGGRFGGIGRLAPTDEGSTFAVAGLEPAPEGKTYELWVMRGGDCPSPDPSNCEVQAAGTFEVTDRSALLNVDQRVGDWEIVAVTLEEEEVDYPTTDPIMSSTS